jgi:hypothetical protein
MDVDVRLTGWVPVAIEQGAPRFDMKPGILGSRESRVIPLDKDPVEFRTMKAQSSGWWHPGLQARSIAAQVQKEMPRLVDDVFKPLTARIKV